MPPSDDKNRIDDLKKSLYSRGTSDVRTHRKLRFSDMNTEDVKPGWTEPAQIVENVHLNDEYEDHSMSYIKKILIGSVLFCVIAIGIGVYLFLNGSNLISGNNIAVTVSGPVSIPGGEPVTFGIKVTNNNSIDLQLVDMQVTFPAGATDPKDPTRVLTSYDQLLGDIPVGVSTSTGISAIIFGEENTQKEITATLTYKVKGSSAIFTKIATYDILINSSPVSVTVDSFSSITSGQEFDAMVSIKSNSQDVLKNIVLKAQYPFGYTFISSNIPPLSDNATWKIGDIPSGGARTIVIHGKLQGEDADTRIFHFSVGAQSSSNASVIGTQYGLVTQNITIEKPFMSLMIGVDNDTSPAAVVGHFNSPNRIIVSWSNNLSVPVSNAVITVQLSGSAYDKTKIRPDLGYFDSANDRIIWNQETNPELGSVAAGANGTVSFTVIPTDTSGGSDGGMTDPSMSISANVTADRTQESQVSGSLAATTNRTIKVASDVSLSGRIVRTIGPFTNTGPIPPQVEQKTTYTVMLTIANTTSAVSNAQVTTTLPPYVTWLGNVSPSNENVTYDQNTGTVTWNAGNVIPNSANSSTGRREMDFQISLQPSVTQALMSPTLVNRSTLTATDNFTQATLSNTQDYLTSSFSTDPGYNSGDEIVGQ